MTLYETAGRLVQIIQRTGNAELMAVSLSPEEYAGLLESMIATSAESQLAYSVQELERARRY
jgi:hypothetical protein